MLACALAPALLGRSSLCVGSEEVLHSFVDESCVC